VVKKVLQSNALYGRTTLEILLKGLTPREAADILSKRSGEEILNHQLIFGGVPKYLEQINPNRSFNNNMNTLCFSPHGIMLKEIERIFYSQFREARTYAKIINLLKNGIFSMGEISTKTKIPSGGGLKQYLENLERAEMIRSFIPFDRSQNSKFRKYTLADHKREQFPKAVRNLDAKKFRCLAGLCFRTVLSQTCRNAGFYHGFCR